MVSFDQLKEGNFGIIIIAVIVSGLGVYLALMLSAAVRVTMDSIFPENLVIAAWIAVIVSLILVVFIIIIFIYYIKYLL